MDNSISTDNFLVKRKSKFNLKDFNTDYKGELTKRRKKMLDVEQRRKPYKLKKNPFRWQIITFGSDSAMDVIWKDSFRACFMDNPTRLLNNKF